MNRCTITAHSSTHRVTYSLPAVRWISELFKEYLVPALLRTSAQKITPNQHPAKQDGYN